MRFSRMAWIAFALTVCFAQVVPQRVRVSESVAQDLLIRGVRPPYPQSARSAKIQDTIVLQVEISGSGIVQSAIAVSGHPLLKPAAIEAVKQWRYKPYLLNGHPVGMETIVRVNFTLEEESAPSDKGHILFTLPSGSPSQTSEASSDPPQIPKRVRVSQRVMQSFLLTRVNPVYPPEAKAGHIEGTIVLRVDIDKDGNVYKADTVGVYPLLGPEAIEAVKQWKYKPYLLNQTAVEVETTVEINFTL